MLNFVTENGTLVFYYYACVPFFINNMVMVSFHLANFTPVYCHPPQCTIVSLDIVYNYITVNWPGKLWSLIKRGTEQNGTEWKS